MSSFTNFPASWDVPEMWNIGASTRKYSLGNSYLDPDKEFESALYHILVNEYRYRQTK